MRNARVRDEGTRNLVAAALAAGARRLIAQSIAWAYAPGTEPHSESDPLDTDAQGDRAITIRGVIALEELTLRSPPLEGIVLRYGQLYGPGTHADVPSASTPVHVDAAAYAALLAIERGAPGAFNIAQPNPHVATAKAVTELGWSADFVQILQVAQRTDELLVAPPPSHGAAYRSSGAPARSWRSTPGASPCEIPCSARPTPAR